MADRESLWLVAVVGALAFGVLVGMWSRGSPETFLHQVLARAALPDACMRRIATAVDSLNGEERSE